ncbi:MULTISPECIES: DJ-1/PfpI family protein [unclassified Paenibacillus]|uniref:DJ-1/PfpI family protein n=1 Tax=unclassified Paenibacillus TaxID=185978 RepID=UPI001AE8D4CD|nr:MULTISPECIES: DJ-1/PfpI family protein [unclassified Paenibacillus]MBP1157317.1 putative intracellular protease/amidase [Paenibacillus sp. PvP091]MBP1171944.1 putative intracellular protease/amidase [Paenibacillus sp. PvR098]MBP2438325.1 putative intracellular protease/amidase [Paenibacillus sp. PvP052]
MADDIHYGRIPAQGKTKGKIGVLVESHYDETEFRAFNEYFPKNGYSVDYISHLWGKEYLDFVGNDGTSCVRVDVEVSDIRTEDYCGIVLIGGYAMDRLRYEANPKQGQLNQAPAVQFLRAAVEALNRGQVKIGTICHSLWLFCADPQLLAGRKVTCAHNVISDVQNAGAEVVFEGDQTQELVIDGNLITGKHPEVVETFVRVFLEEIEKAVNRNPLPEECHQEKSQ